ncbi:two-partner secretion domain-containing protein [Telluria aromaticivorans]|uniref:Filamentous hemagglutinin N-terminal domain-containing protein n=1 Tax=Telluria aromaticivorans TaxID=2725995 RepID=A0A7Y2NZD7_9BURK|nr:filamentous hemagglutinin N-terminal domain-containing protein [Telluria aromaticivorans]NNG22376.1 filamentous hemagglutinin N-terminal domain-containing protein [Telluria aromaticivorans]
MSKMRHGLIRLSRAALCVASCFAATQAAQAAPALPQVVAGQASFSQQGKVYSITNTPGTIINWQSFSVNAGEVTRFIQQSGDSAVLNRILGQDPSRILGALQSNGKVFLINPNGVVFAQGARVDVGGLVASTLNLSDADFLAGKMNFTAGPKAGTVRNEGAITTPSGGKVFLVAPNVENTGIITAPNGEVVLAAGRSVQLVDSSNPDLQVVVSAPNDGAINLGQVVAQGGRIGIYGALVSQRGVVNANSAVIGQDGRIVLKASRDTVLDAGSVTSATGAGKGGEVQLLGARVGLAGNAMVDASGQLGGGTVLVGGDYQGKNALVPNAQQTWFGKDAGIRADALGSGDGGKIVLWSDGATSAHGSISARGAGKGNGGLVETSGHDLDTAGIRVDAGAAQGRTGTWLLDPWNIIVRADGTAPAAAVDVFGKPPGSGDTVVSPATLLATNANIVLQAQNDLTISDNLAALKSVRAEAGNNLAVNALVSSSEGDLDFRAGNRFTLGAGGALASPRFIDLKAERMTLLGNIGGVGGTLPIISFNTFINTTGIKIAGAESGSSLTLDPARLGAFSAFGINLGNSGHVGAVDIDSALTMPGHLQIDSAGIVNVSAPVVLTGGTSQFGGTLHPNLGGGAINVRGPNASITAPGKVELSGGRIVVDGKLSSGAIAIAAGDEGLKLGGVLESSGLVTLRSTSNVIQHNGSTVKAASLLVDAANVDMKYANQVGTLAGAASTGNFRFNWTGALQVGTVAGMSGIAAGSELDLAGGAFSANANLQGLAMFIEADSISGSGTLSANHLSLASGGGIGTGSAPLRINAQVLNATNTATGNTPINILSSRAVTVRDLVQAGPNNTGSITVDSPAGLTVADSGVEGQGVKAGSGSISLLTQGPLTIQGKVRSDSGNIRLDAGSSGALTVGPGAQVASATGSVQVAAATTAIAPGSIVVSSPDKLTVTSPNAPAEPGTPVPAPAPTLAACIANPAASGCAPVLAAATQACIVNPDGPNCGQVLPTPAACRVNPSTNGCATVLERAALMACIAEPSGPGCAAVLPTYEVCVATPGKPGCAPVLARAQFEACLANPSASGCLAVLPSLAVCKATPGLPGCAQVLQLTLNACLVNPGDAACSGVLPTVSQCIVNRTTPGCSVVLPTLAQCTGNPSLPGCAVTLPSLAQCVGNSSLQGCSVVLPTLSQCIGNPSLAGCAATLPTLSQCVGSPSLQGCSVILPTLAQCVASPTLQGCAVVLPSVSSCVANPTSPACQVVAPSTGGEPQAPVAQAQQATVNLINTRTPATPGTTAATTPASSGDGAKGDDASSDKTEQQAGPASGTNPGVKNEKPAAKMYCN